MSTKRTRGNPIPLIREDHPDDYTETGYPFITLIQYQHESLLTIIDNVNSKIIQAYVLDLCKPHRVDEQMIVDVANDWFGSNSDRFPLSFEFSRRGLTATSSKIYRTYNVDFITRVIGPLPMFDMCGVPAIKRRRRKPVPNGMAIQMKSM